MNSRFLSQKVVRLLLILSLLLPISWHSEPVRATELIHEDAMQVTNNQISTNSLPSAMANFTAVSVGWRHTCGLTSGGGVKCWGYNGNGLLGDGTTFDRSTPVNVIGLESGVVAIATGADYTCALTSIGGVKCWGDNSNGQLGDNTVVNRNAPVDVIGLTSGVTAIATGSYHTCAVTASGGVKCWGDNSNGQLGDNTIFFDRASPVDVVGLGSGVKAISASSYHTCAVTTVGGIKCWGKNDGQLGDGTTTQRKTPVDVIGLGSEVVAMSTGTYHSCALTSTGGVKCWGWNGNGQLGDGTTGTQRLTPVDVSGLGSGVAAIASDSAHTCAVTTIGKVKCWGWNGNGQIGDNTTTDRNLPVDVNWLENEVATNIEAGSNHTCAVTSGGGVKCWGKNSNGQLGDGRTMRRAIPVDVIGLVNGMNVIAADEYRTCSLTSSGGVKCWGANGFGLLGDGTTIYRSAPVDVLGLNNITAIAMGYLHSCVLTASGGVKCWGSNGSGQLGDGTTTNRTSPVDVIGLDSGVISLTAGNYHTCALTTTGGVKCWGSDKIAGQHSTPLDINGLTSGVKAIAAGWYYTCAVTSSGGVKCWGDNENGQLGDNTNTNRNAPVDVVGLSEVVNIVAGGGHTCALTSTGGVKCWGWNKYGQLGDSTNTDQKTPVDVIGLTSGVTSLTSGWSHVCAVSPSGGVKCWGANSDSQLGDGTSADRNLPVDVSGLESGVTALAAGWMHTCALLEEGRPKCWGLDTSGQLGTGSLIQSLTPVAVIESAPLLELNYSNGQPGSYFTVSCSNFPALSSATISINYSHVFTTTVPINSLGSCIFFIDTHATNPGYYQVTASVNAANRNMEANASSNTSAYFSLTDGGLLRNQEGGGQSLTIPAGLNPLSVIFLPHISR